MVAPIAIVATKENNRSKLGFLWVLLRTHKNSYPNFCGKSLVILLKTLVRLTNQKNPISTSAFLILLLVCGAKPPSDYFNFD